MGINKDRIERLEEAAAEFTDTLVLADGTEVEIAPGELLDGFLAVIDGGDHRLVPHLRDVEGELGELVRAIAPVGEEEGDSWG